MNPDKLELVSHFAGCQCVSCQNHRLVCQTEDRLNSVLNWSRSAWHELSRISEIVGDEDHEIIRGLLESAPNLEEVAH